jgi:heptose I phosphotransferase
MLPEAIRQSIPQDIMDALPIGSDPFQTLLHMPGEVFRDVPGRRTIKTELAGQSYFIKQHFGVGWKEIFKNLVTFRLPVVSAITEWNAIHALERIGIHTTPAVAYGERGCSLATRQSFLMTKDLGDITSLETLGFAWQKDTPDPRFKRHLINAVAALARRLHESGMNHRDFYICHICLDNRRWARGEIYLYLIDLHRVGIRQRIRTTDRLKDIAALYFSAMDIGLTKRDFLRFLRVYRQQRLKDIFREEAGFWQRVQQRASRLFFKFHGVVPSEHHLGV